jgi:hypothetical protein
MTHWADIPRAYCSMALGRSVLSVISQYPTQECRSKLLPHPLYVGTGGMVSNAIGTHALQSRGYSADQIHSWEAGSSYAVRCTFISDFRAF